VHGRSVREILNARGALAPAQAAAVLDQTLAALDHAHTRGIVHRDLKPENILITTDGVVKVTDLGLARAFADAKNTRAGAVTGTVQYLAPEQIRGEPADPRSDLYSLGIVGFELLTDTLPFTGETPMAIAYKHLSDRVPSPSSVTPTVPTAFDGFIVSATDPDREMRPESAAAMRLDLATFSATLERARTLASLVNEVPRVVRDPASGEATAAIPPAAITQSIPQVGRHRRRRGRGLLVVLLALLTVAVAAWGAWSYVIPHSHAIPSVVGLTTDEASQQLHDLGFTVQLGAGHFDQSPRNTVLSVDPPEGTSLREGETVTLTPSLGPPPVPVPDVTNATQEAATTELRHAGFTVGAIKQVYSDTVAEGHVVRQDPAIGKAPDGSAIDLWISKGHAPEAIPAVVGKTQKAAERILRAAGFVSVTKTAYSNDIDRGDVISVDPPEAEMTPYGSAVTILVSQGPETFPVPTLTGLSPAAAEAKAKDAGLQVEFFYVPNTPQTVVISQNPAAGATVHAGDTITLFIA